MKHINNWQDLEPFGIVFLTGESCGLMYRILADLTVNGKMIVEKCLGLRDLGAHENWNGSSRAGTHVASILLAPEMLAPLAAFALLESGCIECWIVPSGSVIGIEPDDDRVDCVSWIRQTYPPAGLRRLAYQGTAKDRNVHVFTQRVN